MRIILTPIIWRLMEDKNNQDKRNGRVEQAIGVVRAPRHG